MLGFVRRRPIPGRDRLNSTQGIWSLLSLLSLAVLGCGDGSPGAEHGREIAVRFIAEEPLSTFERERLYDEVSVFDWTFASDNDLAQWRLNRFDSPPRRVSGGVLVERGARAPELVRDVDLDAMEVDVVEVDVGGLVQGPLRWFWTREGENFVAERGILVKGSDEAGTTTRTHRLDVGSHREWTGQIRRLRLDATTSKGEVVRLERVRGLRYQAPEGFLDAAVRLPWKVDLGHEQRNALLAPPGMPTSREIEIPRGAQLRFSYGAEGRANCPVRFRILAAAARKDVVTLFDAVLDPATDELAEWHPGMVDLAAFGGKTLVLTLVVEAIGDGKLNAMPVWGNPEILRPASEPPRPNVVLISVDTLRPDHLSVYGYGRETSPQLAAWAQRSAIVFETVVASAPWTLPSHVSLLSGLDADRHGVNHRLPMPSEIHSLSEVFRQAGYRTLAITGGGWMHPQYGFGQGFDRFRYWPPKTPKDDEVAIHVAQSLEWLEETADEPFLLFLHTFEAHSPHRRREPFYSRLGGTGNAARSQAVVTERSSAPPATGYLVSKEFYWHREGFGLSLVDHDEMQEVIDRYDSGIAYADAQIGRLLGRLDELGLAENTLVVVTSDHGEAFGEKGLDSHGYLYDFNLKIPLIMALPSGQEAGRRISEQIRSVDLMPTLLDWAGLPLPAAGEIDGRSLRPLLSGREEATRDAWSYAGSSNRGLALRRSGRMKYILNNTAWRPLRGQEELYDLATDSAESQDLAATAPHISAIREQALMRLARLANGLEVRLRNAEDTPLHGTVRGAAIRVFQLKALDVEGASVFWDESRSREAAFTIPPGASGAFLIESALPEELEVEVELVSRGDAGRFRGIVGAQLEAPWRLTYRASGWAVAESATPEVATAMTIIRRGIAPSTAVSDPSAVNPQLKEQLEALGYLQ